MTHLKKGACVITATVTAAFLIFASHLAFAQSKDSSDTEVVQTEVGLDQIAPQTSVSTNPASNVSADKKPALTDDEQKAILINESLKNAVEENKKLSQENQAMEEELKNLRGTNEVNNNRVTFLNNQREILQKRVQDIENENKQYQEQMKRLQESMSAKEKELEDKVTSLESQISEKKAEEEEVMSKVLPRAKEGKEAVSSEDIANLRKEAQEKMKEFEGHAQKVASEVNQLNLENQKLKVDSAKLHYNLANTFFERGEYKRSAIEYARVVDLMPNDADAHYNLAFVSGEFLKDYKTAAEHYQQYLFLNPHAEDAALVKEKILAAQLELKTNIESPINKLTEKKMDRPIKTVSDVRDVR